MVSVSGARAQEQTPSYLPSYTRLGHAIPGSKTVSVGDWCARTPTPTTYLLIALAALISVCWCCSGCVEGSVNVMGRKGGNRLFPTLTLTLTFHHPEQSLLHKLHWLDHVIRVGVFSVSRARLPITLTLPSTHPEHLPYLT